MTSDMLPADCHLSTRLLVRRSQAEVLLSYSTAQKTPLRSDLECCWQQHNTGGKST